MKTEGIAGLFIIGLFGVLGAGATEKKISQDDVSLDLSSGNIHFNDEVVNAEQLEERVRESYSISLSAGDYSDHGGDDHGVDDLFGEAPVSRSAPTPVFPVSRLIDALEPIEAAGIDPKLVRLNMFMSGDKNSGGDSLVIGAGTDLLLNKKRVNLAELSSALKGNLVVGMKRENGEHVVDYHRFLEVMRALGPDVSISALYCDARSYVSVSAEIYTLRDDGSKNVLSAPRFTTVSGNEGGVGVVHNDSGMKTFESDEFHQKDLGNLGNQFFVEPRIIGDYITLSGIAVIRRSLGKEEVFREGDVPIYSYSSNKTVVPISFTFSPGENSVEFKIADVDGGSAMCRLSAEVVDDRGRSRADREKARAATR